MVKFVLVTTLALVASTFAYVEDRDPVTGDTRLCPDEYFYAGDDTPKVTKDVWLEERSRSPTYSCYKVSDKDADYFKATRTCEEDKGHLISLEDTEEIERLYKKKNATKDVTFFTSALYFSFETEWRWMSESNNSQFDHEEVELSGSCLSLNDGSMESTNCLEEQSFICELRVETVTYFAWFVANWFSLLLVFLVVVLLISLCVTTSMFRQRHRESGRVYRASAGPILEDKPPSYGKATGTDGNRYLNRGREFLAKVTISPARSNDEKA